MELALALSPIPPPCAYLTVSVVFDGANPKAFVFKKFEGSNALVKNLDYLVN